MPSSFLKHLISVAYNFLRMSAVNVQVSQAYNSREITRERRERTFRICGLRESRERSCSCLQKRAKKSTVKVSAVDASNIERSHVPYLK